MSQANWKSDALLVPFFAIHKVYIRCMLTIRNVYKKVYIKMPKLLTIFINAVCFLFSRLNYIWPKNKSLFETVVTPSTAVMRVDKFETKGAKKRMVLNA